MPLAGLHTGAETLQGAVHAGGAHAPAHRREATQVHGEWARGAALLHSDLCRTGHVTQAVGCVVRG